MKHTTKKGTEITFGNPEYSAADHLYAAADHLDALAGRVFIIGNAASSLAALSALAPKRGARAKAGLERTSGKVLAIGTAIGAGSTAIRAIQVLRQGKTGGMPLEVGVEYGEHEVLAGDPSPTIDGQIDLNAIRDKILGQ